MNTISTNLLRHLKTNHPELHDLVEGKVLDLLFRVIFAVINYVII